MDYVLYTLVTLFIIICVFLILLVLIQKGRGGGLSSAFGGASGNTAFGAKTGDVLTWATSIVFGIFLILAVSLNLICTKIQAANTAAIVPVAPPVAPTGPAIPTDSTDTSALKLRPDSDTPPIAPPTTQK